VKQSGAGPSIPLHLLAEKFGLKIAAGAQDFPLRGVASLASAGALEVSFFASGKYRSQFLATHAGAVLVKPSDALSCPSIALVSSDPYADFARIAQFFHPEPIVAGGIHSSAVLEPGATVHPSAHIGAQCFIAASARIEAGANISAQCFIGPDCVVGPYSELMPRVSLVKRVELGRCVRIHSGAVLGADGFGFAPSMQDGGFTWLKIPQLGRVLIGDGCDIGANTTIDCGALDDTVLGQRVIIDNQVQVGHNVQIGDFTAIAGCTAIAGSAKIGARCMIAGGVGIAGHLEICDGAVILAMSLVTHSITTPGAYAGVMPLMPQRDWQRASVRIKQLDDTLKSRKLDSESQGSP
jgi:UDP-3-O-[3-hydroxymyristoyl] glucosamine N-acyltransferase